MDIFIFLPFGDVRAVRAGDLERVQEFTKSGANLSPPDGQAAPLHYAVRFGHLEIVTWLLGQKVNVNAHDQAGWTPLHYAASSQHAEMVEPLLAAGADLNAVNQSGVTPLHEAVKYRAKTVLEAFLKADADTTIPDSKGRTPLQTALQIRRGDMAPIRKMLQAYQKD